MTGRKVMARYQPNSQGNAVGPYFTASFRNHAQFHGKFHKLIKWFLAVIHSKFVVTHQLSVVNEYTKP